jgi:hypothetical protein
LQCIKGFGRYDQPHSITPGNANKLLERHEYDIGGYILGCLELKRTLNELVVELIPQSLVNSRPVQQHPAGEASFAR